MTEEQTAELRTLLHAQMEPKNNAPENSQDQAKTLLDHIRETEQSVEKITSRLNELADKKRRDPSEQKEFKELRTKLSEEKTKLRTFKETKRKLRRKSARAGYDKNEKSDKINAAKNSMSEKPAPILSETIPNEEDDLETREEINDILRLLESEPDEKIKNGGKEMSHSETARRIRNIVSEVAGGRILSQKVLDDALLNIPDEHGLREQIRGAINKQRDLIDLSEGEKDGLDFDLSEEGPKISIGDEIQWTSGGIDYLPPGSRVEKISPDGQFVFVGGSKTGLPAKEVAHVKPAEAKNDTPEKIEGVGTYLELTADKERIKRLEAKLAEYKNRFAKKAHLAPEKQQDLYFRHYILENLLKNKRLEISEIKNEMKAKYGSVFKESVFLGAVRVVDDYNTTGGLATFGGTGLPKPAGDLEYESWNKPEAVSEPSPAPVPEAPVETDLPNVFRSGRTGEPVPPGEVKRRIDGIGIAPPKSPAPQAPASETIVTPGTPRVKTKEEIAADNQPELARKAIKNQLPGWLGKFIDVDAVLKPTGETEKGMSPEQIRLAERITRATEQRGEELNARAEKLGMAERARTVGNWWKGQPTSRKLMLSAGLAGASLGAAFAGSAVGLAAVGTALMVTRGLSGAALFVGLEKILEYDAKKRGGGEDLRNIKQKNVGTATAMIGGAVGGLFLGSAIGHGVNAVLDSDLAKSITDSAKELLGKFGTSVENVVYVVQPGNTFWGIVKSELNDMGVMQNLSPQGKNYLLDALTKHAPSLGYGNVDLIHPGQEIDLKNLLADKEFFNQAYEKALGLGGEQALPGEAAGKAAVVAAGAISAAEIKIPEAFSYEEVAPPKQDFLEQSFIEANKEPGNPVTAPEMPEQRPLEPETETRAPAEERDVADIQKRFGESRLNEVEVPETETDNERVERLRKEILAMHGESDAAAAETESTPATEPSPAPETTIVQEEEALTTPVVETTQTYEQMPPVPTTTPEITVDTEDKTKSFIEAANTPGEPVSPPEQIAESLIPPAETTPAQSSVIPATTEPVIQAAQALEIKTEAPAVMETATAPVDTSPIELTETEQNLAFEKGEGAFQAKVSDMFRGRLLNPSLGIFSPSGIESPEWKELKRLPPLDFIAIYDPEYNTLIKNDLGTGRLTNIFVSAPSDQVRALAKTMRELLRDAGMDPTRYPAGSTERTEALRLLKGDPTSTNEAARTGLFNTIEKAMKGSFIAIETFKLQNAKLPS